MTADLSFVQLVLDASFIVQLVLILLLAASIGSWAIIIRKWRILQRAVTLCEGNSILPEDLILEQVSVRDPHMDTPEREQEQSLDTYIGDIEKQMLEDALKKAHFNKTRAAGLLGISFRSLRYKLKKFGID